jgi:hypothetical protein
MQRDQSVSQMAEEALLHQAKVLAQRNGGHSLEEARQAVSETEAGLQLRDLAEGEHRHEKAQARLARFGSAPRSDLCASTARRFSRAL